MRVDQLAIHIDATPWTLKNDNNAFIDGWGIILSQWLCNEWEINIEI